MSWWIFFKNYLPVLEFDRFRSHYSYSLNRVNLLRLQMEHWSWQQCKVFVLFLSCTGQFWQNKEELCECVFAHSLEVDAHMGVLGHKFTLLHHGLCTRLWKISCYKQNLLWPRWCKALAFGQTVKLMTLTDITILLKCSTLNGIKRAVVFFLFTKNGTTAGSNWLLRFCQIT